jgi:Fur family transcriptional regulator, ferric uptake regulator
MDLTDTEMKRKTNQRNAIQEVFRKIDRPLGINEILENGRRTVESLNQATVYRNLKILVENGWLKKINTPKQDVRYERAGKEHHHHFQCRFCDRLFEISGCAFNEQSATPPGFITEGHEVYLYGICSSCRD